MRHLTTIGLCTLLLALTAPVMAQTYGSGASISVPHVESGTITIDGQMDEEAWQDARVLTIDKFAWDGGWNTAGDTEPGYAPEPDVDVTVRLLYEEGRLLAHILYEDYQDFFWSRFGGD
ncbi:MAG: hypothetical protein ACOCTG_04205, partial [Bacteroidota bacterium]